MSALGPGGALDPGAGGRASAAQRALATDWSRFQALNSGDHGPGSLQSPQPVLSAAPASC